MNLSAPDHDLPLALPVPSYEDWIDALVLSASTRTTSFGKLVRGLPGVSPQEAIQSLRRIGSTATRCLADDAALDHVSGVIDQWRELPLPHPLDSEFRFSPSSADELAQELVNATSPGDDILLVGAPTVALALSAMNVDRHIQFVGPNDCVTDAVRSHLPDRADEPGQSAAALFDPPWYQHDVEVMADICANACRPGATLLMATPRAGSRPSARSDIQTFTEAAHCRGFATAGLPSIVNYRTPLFELACMEQQGLGRLADWRTGTMLRFERTDANAHSSPLPPSGPVELTVDGVRLRLLSVAYAGPRHLTPIAASDVFPSVSTRAPHRHSANLWTSGNRAFAIDSQLATVALQTVARDFGLGHPAPPAACQATLFRGSESLADATHLIHAFHQLIERELSDARRLVGDGAWSKIRRWQS